MKTALKFGKPLGYLLAMVLGIAYLATLPLAVYYLLNFLIEELMISVFVPPVAVLMLACGWAALTQWRAHNLGLSSGPLRLPAPLWFGAVTLGGLGLGQAMTGGRFWTGMMLVFPVVAAAPPLAALALAARRLPELTTWRRALAGLVTGAALSTHLTILLTAGLSALAYALVLPLRDAVAWMVASPSLEKLFYSPALVAGLVAVALVAPIVEEATKPLGAIILARRLRTPAEAFLVGMAGGVGFAIVENFLYMALGYGGWVGVAGARAMSGALHPLNAGLVAVGWWGVRNGLPNAWARLGGFYALAVGIHALWNGSLGILYSGLGRYFFGTEVWTVDTYGLGEPGIVVVLLLLQAVIQWRLLYVLSGRLREGVEAKGEPFVGLRLERPHRLAVWAAASFVVVLSLSALYGPAVTRYLGVLMPVR
ncbi:MAG: PrsW family glutamic-type intramembrane protease [Chloroflexota bacterium]